MGVSAISSSNVSLQFIEKRIADNNYRGDASSEHNRYDMTEIHNILLTLKKYAPNKSLLQIRDTDLSKRPQNTVDERDYERFCVEVKNLVGKGTQDSIRKNIFLDLHRMGFIERYGKDKIAVSPYNKKSRVKYVSITEMGIRFVNETNILYQKFIFSKALDILLGGYLDVALNILKDKDYGIDTITKYDFMFFVSAVNSQTSFSLTTAECVEMIKEFRKLSRVQQTAVIETLKDEMQPKNYLGDKTNKRDWHNWQNKIDQVFHLFKQTPYFDVSGKDKELLRLSTKEIKTKNGEIVEIMSRSISAKHDYFTNHKIRKVIGFELHHIVPLAWAESPEQYKLFDVWQNLIYIDGFSHNKITQNKNKNIIMTSNGTTIVLSDYNNVNVELIFKTNILYLVQLQSTMLAYNSRLRETV